ncbi:GDP-fucose synthetase [Pigmentiphaga sp. NML080357]|uniref:GDP-L-fucose synthase family protein n=1 Tax=Pigmentiphaga sp. NML080357 TaxID=2008675 RepID=UPI000B41076F|nr:GDP-L-fucose synthase [Pigmentiphaga sp. NML080357]OVZ58490.1 GDP-fucose synthetase [Pigmentiphaga sp. NML080357]
MKTGSARIFVAGHRGMVGSAIRRELERKGYAHLLTPSRHELNLENQAAVQQFFDRERPDVVYLAAAKVGGILDNERHPVAYLARNLLIQTNVIRAAYESGVAKLLFLGSSCIYPRLAPQPMREEHLLTGPLESTNEAYAIAKIAGVKLCEAYRREFGSCFVSAMPTNLYGRGDNYDLERSHVLPALIRKFHEGKLADSPSVTIWGTGQPLREFLHVDDLARACVHLMEGDPDQSIYNIGSGEEISIADLARLVARIVGYEGRLKFDLSRPDGTPRKLLDSSRMRALGWKPEIPLAEGIAVTYRQFLRESGALQRLTGALG